MIFVKIRNIVKMSHGKPCIITTMPNQDRYTWLFRHLPIVASMMDADGRIIDVSDTWIERLGYDRDELTGMSPMDIATAASARQIREEHMPTFRRTGRLDRVVVEFVAKDGETVSMLATTIAELDEQGRFLHSLSVFSELSDYDQLHARYRDRYQSTPGDAAHHRSGRAYPSGERSLARKDGLYARAGNRSQHY